MTKLIIIFALMASSLCAFAQGGEVVERGLEAAFKGGATVSTEQLLRLVGRQAFPRPGVQLAEIINWSTKPLVQVVSNQNITVPSMKMISAQAVNGEAFRRVVFPQLGVRNLPVELNDSAPALYRGMPLNLKDIKNLLKKGMELERSSFRQLYFSADIDVALACANEENLLLPVVVKVNVTPELEALHPPHLYEYDNYVFNGNIPAQFIKDGKVMVFLEVNGEPGWYKATLENDELLLKPTTTKLFQKSDLIKHRFDTPFGTPDISLHSLWEDLSRNEGLW